MREIDLLPQWYKNGRRRQKGYRVQYAALGVIAVLIMVVNFTMSNYLSKSEAEIIRNTSQKLEAEKFLKEYEAAKNELARLKEKESLIGETGTKIDVAGVLGELSFLIDEKIVLTGFSLSGETFSDQTGIKSASGGNFVRSGKSTAGKGARQYLGDLRYKVTASGIAADAAAVAELICRLEDSPYFCQVVPLYSRERKTESKNSGYAVTEFEVACYVANYEPSDSK
jgi:hypothetical protein